MMMYETVTRIIEQNGLFNFLDLVSEMIDSKVNKTRQHDIKVMEQLLHFPL